MEQAGWVSRCADPVDRRVKMVRLTEAGARILESAQEAYLDRVKQVVSVLPEADRKKLCNLLEAVRGRLRGLREE